MKTNDVSIIKIYKFCVNQYNWQIVLEYPNTYKFIVINLN